MLQEQPHAEITHSPVAVRVIDEGQPCAHDRTEQSCERALRHFTQQPATALTAHVALRRLLLERHPALLEGVAGAVQVVDQEAHVAEATHLPVVILVVAVVVPARTSQAAETCDANSTALCNSDRRLLEGRVALCAVVVRELDHRAEPACDELLLSVLLLLRLLEEVDLLGPQVRQEIQGEVAVVRGAQKRHAKQVCVEHSGHNMT
jgi:hypothetical protein